MTPEKIVENHKKYVLQSWSKQGNLNPIPVAKADGIYFYDFDGNRYTDMSSQLVNLNLGYGNKAIGDAIIGVPVLHAVSLLFECHSDIYPVLVVKLGRIDVFKCIK